MIRKTMLILLLLAIALGVYVFRSSLFYSYFAEASPETIQKSEVTVIAHRGASGHAPENTLSAIKKAIEMQADRIEIDIHLTKDGEVIVFHDATLDRTTNVSGRLDETLWADMALLDAGSWFDEAFAGEPIPRLVDVLELMQLYRDSLQLNVELLVEIKNNSEGAVYPTLAQKTIDLLAVYDNSQNPWCIVQAFNSSYLEEVREYLAAKQISYNPELQKLIFTDFSPFPAYIDFTYRWGYAHFTNEPYTAVNPYYRSLTKGKVEAAHKRGKQVNTYTVNEVEDMKKLIEMGVDGIITNYPDRLVMLKKGN